MARRRHLESPLDGHLEGLERLRDGGRPQGLSEEFACVAIAEQQGRGHGLQ